MIIRNIIYELINSDGKIKEYDDKGYLRFKGEYLNEKRNGYGKECNFQMKNWNLIEYVKVGEEMNMEKNMIGIMESWNLKTNI